MMEGFDGAGAKAHRFGDDFTAREKSCPDTKPGPQGLKPSILVGQNGTAEAVPFQNNGLLRADSQARSGTKPQAAMAGAQAPSAAPWLFPGLKAGASTARAAREGVVA
jgi:hypothetical protein